MTDTYVINTVFKSHDQMTSTVSRLTDKMSLFGKRSENSFRRATLGATRFKTVLGGVLGANLITAGMNQLRMGIGAVTTEFLDFDNAVTSAASKWGIERGTAAFKELGAVARDVAKVTPKTAGETGSALDFLAMAGFNAQQAMAALPGVTQLSIAAQTDLARSSDIVSDALSSLGLMTTNSTKLTENLNRVNDVFVKTTTTSNTNLEMLFESMKMVAPVASNLGAEVEGLSAMIGTLANSGIKATMSGTALRNMYLRLTSGTEGAGKVLKKYNIKILDPHTKKMRNMIDILEEVRQKTKHLDDKKKQAAYTDLFGARAVASATVLMKAGGKALHDYEKRLQGATGETKRMAEAMGKSWQNRIAALKSRLIEIGLKIFDVFENEIPNAFSKVEAWLDQFDGEQFKKWIIETKNEVKPLVVGFIDLIKQGGRLVGWLKESGVTIGDVVKIFIGWKLAVLALNTALITTKGSLAGLLATKGLPMLMKALAALGIGGSAAIGVGVGGAVATGKWLLGEQASARDRLLTMKKKEKERQRFNKSLGDTKTKTVVKEMFPKDPVLQELAARRIQETGNEKMITTNNISMPEKSVIEINIKSPFETNTQTKQGKNSPVIKTNKKIAPAISGNLGKN